VIADDEWSEPTLDATIEIGATRTIRLEEPMPVYVLYLTAAPDQNGIVRYAEDIYERDAEVLRALAHEASWQAATRQQTETECALAH
jgi:murein L,D-transpeptidase YcbB/YkuD